MMKKPINGSKKLCEYLLLLKKSSVRFAVDVENIRSMETGNNQTKLVEKMMVDYFIPFNPNNWLQVFSYVLMDRIYFNVEFHYVPSGIKHKIEMDGAVLLMKMNADINANEWRDLWFEYKRAKESLKNFYSKELFPVKKVSENRKPKKFGNMDLYLEILRLKKCERWTLAVIHENLSQIKKNIGHPPMPTHNKEEVRMMLGKIQRLIDVL